MIDDNDTMIDFANIESNNQWDTCISAGGEKGGRWSICVDAAPLYLLLYSFASASALEEEDETSEAFTLSMTRRKEEEEASEVEYDIIHAYAIMWYIFHW